MPAKEGVIILLFMQPFCKDLGGTNFGYMNGAADTQPVTTTYDYDAPLTEAGDPTPKLMVIRSKIKSLTGRIPPPMPAATPKAKYGKIRLQRLGGITDLLDKVSPPQKTRVKVLSYASA